MSKMHEEKYGSSIIQYNKIPLSYLNRMQFVRDEGCNAMILTGDCEPQQNMPFLVNLLVANKNLRTPFYNITMQTTGSGLEYDELRNLAHLGLTTLSLSISSFDAGMNAHIIGMPEKERRDLYEVQRWAKSLGLVTRASVNLTDEFNLLEPSEYFKWAIEHEFDQLTFRRIYADGDNAQADWIAQHPFDEDRYEEIEDYVKGVGTPIARLPFGFIKYSVHGISTVIDSNCMAKDEINDMKYAILRPNGHLYSRWDDTGSLIF